MHDIKAIRDDEDGRYLKGWLSRGVKDAGAQLEAILRLDAELRAAQTRFQTAQAKRNELSKQIGQAKGQKDEARAQALMTEVEGLKGEIEAAFAAEGDAGKKLKDILAALPNIPDADVPEGEDEAGNVEVRRWSDRAAVPAGKLNATPRDHVDLGAMMGMMDFEAAARMSGSRFVVLKRQLARLERAIGQFMLDVQTTENGYTEMSVPLLVNDDAMFGTGQLPKFEDDLFKIEVDFYEAHQGEYDLAVGENGGMAFVFKDKAKQAEFDNAVERAPWTFHGKRPIGETYEMKLTVGERRYLIPTAEVSLTNLVREQITDEAELPLRLTALTPCFRSEAGASGRDTRGMIRQHQFWKCELVSIATPETSEAEHEHMIASAEGILKKLELPFRTMALCTGDMGFTARRTYDLEVWLPSQNTYREISSISNCGDFQARRMDARFKRAGEKGGRYVHTLNGSGLAVGRTLVAILENYQDMEGRVAIPSALVPYMGGVTSIGGQG